MSVGLFRGIIVALGIIWTILFILLLVMMFRLYRKMSALHTSIKQAVAETKEAIKPIMQITAIFDAVRNGIDIFNKISEKRKGGKENEQRSVD